MKRIDLHTHSTCSDGSFTPTELVRHARQNNIDTIALTDHDSLAGLNEAEAEAKRQGIEFVAGIELAVRYKEIEVHMLGLKIRPTAPALCDMLPQIEQIRLERNLKMIKLLNESGINITFEDLANESSDSTITRLHFANALVKLGVCANKREAFSKYLSPECKTYVPREFINAQKGIELIKASGGIPILAHATLYHLDFTQIEEMVRSLSKLGLMGLECYYSTFSQPEHQFMKKLAKKYRLYMSGGSDFHGSNKPRIEIGIGTGNLFIPYSLWENLNNI